MKKTTTVSEFAALHGVSKSAILWCIHHDTIAAQKVRVAGHVVYYIDLDAESTKSYKPRGYAGVSRPNSEKSTHNADGTMTCYGFALLAGCAEVTVQRHAKSGILFAFKNVNGKTSSWHIPKEHPQNEAYVKKHQQKNN